MRKTSMVPTFVEFTVYSGRESHEYIFQVANVVHGVMRDNNQGFYLDREVRRVSQEVSIMLRTEEEQQLIGQREEGRASQAKGQHVQIP